MQDCTCDPGFLRVNDTCVIGRPPAYYFEGKAQPCSSFRETTVALASTSGACVCVAGYAAYPWNEPCAACTEGTYQPHVNSTICLNCPDNSFHQETASVNRTDCLCDPGHTGADGGLCAECAEGFVKNVSGSALCSPCPINSHSDGPGNRVCTPCHADSTTAGQHTADVAGCLCDPGFEPNGTNACQACAVGKFKNISSNDACQVCPAGQFEDESQSTACRSCGVNSAPVADHTDCKCNKGYAGQHNVSAPVCEACQSGQYSDEVGQESCDECESDQHVSDTASVAVGDCFCRSGYTGTMYSCDACEAGKYKDYHTDNYVDEDDCDICPAHTQSPNASTALTDCICVVGFTADNDGVVCIECGFGKFKNTTGTGECQQCPENTFQAQTGQTACTDCIVRSTTQGLTGQDSVADCLCRVGSVRLGSVDDPFCSDCKPGEFADVDGCQNCSATSYTVDPGATKCTPCMNNSVADATGTGCVCNAGYTTPCPPVQCAGEDITPTCSSDSCPEVVTSPGHNGGWHKRYAIDRDIDTQYQSATSNYQNGIPTWLSVDLGIAQALGKLRHRNLYGRVTNGHRHLTWRIRLGPSPDFYSAANYDVDCGNDPSDPSDPSDACFPEGTDVNAWLYGKIARYVFIWKTANDGEPYLNIGELGIYAACPCPDGNCIACPVDTYKDTIGFEGCTACQANAQSPEASTQEPDCKCNRGFQQNGESVCVACVAGTFSHNYDTSGLDASTCASCPNYTWTDPVPADGLEDCKDCALCNTDEYWDDGCRVPDDNTDAVCESCPSGLSGSVPATRNAMPGSLNEGPDACVCLPGVYYSEEPYPSVDLVVDSSRNLARDCTSLKHTYCPNQMETDSANPDHQYIGSIDGVWCTRTLAATTGIYGRKDVLGNPDVGGKWKRCRDDSTGENVCPTKFCQTSTQAKYLTITLDDDMMTIPIHHVDIDVSGDADDTIKLLLIDNSGIITPANVQSFYKAGDFITWVLQPIQTAKKIRIFWPARDVPFRVSYLREVNIFGPQERDPGCDYCPDGHYKPDYGPHACTACPSGTDTQPCYNATDNCDAFADCLCAAGFFLNASNVCEKCRVGFAKISINNVESCTACPSNENSWDATGQTPITGVPACTCDPGFSRVDGSCAPCLPGTSKAIGGDQACTACPSGRYQDEHQATECKTCQDNSASTEGLHRCTCDAGFQNHNGTSYHPDGTQCQACVNGSTFKTTNGDERCSTCTLLCDAYTRFQAVCVSDRDLQCQGCQANSNIPFRNLAEYCLCNAGFEFDTNGCVQCDIGKAKASNSNNSIFCESCISGSTYADTRAFEVCASCNTHCGDFTDQEYVSAECTVESNTQCSDCRNCLAGQYELTGCGLVSANDRDNTVCTDCPANSYCLGDTARDYISCGDNAVSPPRSDEIGDCICGDGYYDSINSGLDSLPACEECGYDFFCHTGNRFSCPNNSITHGTRSTHILDCQCVRGHHRVFSADETSFTCPRCEPGDWCFNNSAYNCSDARMSTTHPAFRISNCTCEDGWYNNDDDTVCIACPRDSYCRDGVRYNCSALHWTNNLENVDNPDGCLCRPGLTPDPTNDDTCVACPSDTYCPGDENVYACRNFSESQEGSAQEFDCKCSVGYGYLEGACEQCAPGTFFKVRVSNTPCTACQVCSGADGNSLWTAEVCHPLHDTKCLSCSACENGKYVYMACNSLSDTACANCTSCQYPQYTHTSCGPSNQALCANITFEAECPEDNTYRGGHTARTDSLCLPCKTKATPYEGMQLHSYVGSQWTYNDPFSCAIKCLGASRMVNRSNHSLGCTTCETGNVLFKEFALFDISAPDVCQFECRTGYIREAGDCRLPPVTGRTQPNVSISDVVLGDPYLVVTVAHADLSRSVILVSGAAPACPQRSRSALEQCCWPGAFVASKVGLAGSADPCVDQYINATRVDARTLHIRIPRHLLHAMADCSSIADAVTRCELIVTQFDVLTSRLHSARVELQTSSSKLLAVIPTAQLYIPLEAFDVIIMPAFTHAGSTIFRVVTTVKGLHDIAVGMRVRGMTRFNDTAPAQCAHIAHQGLNNTSPFWHVGAGETVTTTTYWQGYGSIVRVFYALRTALSVMDIAAHRDVSDVTAVCGSRPSLHEIEGLEILATAGLGRQALDALRSTNGTLVSNGILSNLVTVFARARTDSYVTHTVGDILAVSTLTPTDVRVAVDARNARLELDALTARACLNNPNCSYEYLNSNPTSDLTHTVHCTVTGRNAARAWIVSHFRVHNPHEHVEALCQRVEGSAHAAVGVLVHTLSSRIKLDFENYRKWSGMYGPVYTKLFAFIRFN